MASYSLSWKTSALQDLKRLDRQLVPDILAAAESLADNPFPTQSRKLQSTESRYRLRVGDYRVIYRVDIQALTVTINHVRHRREAYR